MNDPRSDGYEPVKGQKAIDVGSIDIDNTQEVNELIKAADNLALAAALVVTDYDGIHRLRAKLALYYDLRAGIHGSKHNKAVPNKLGQNK